MYLYKLKLWNFRKYGSTEPFDIAKPNLIVNFQQGLNLLVGENDSGKTSIIDAIKYVLLTNSREYIRLDLENDFFKKGERANKLRIECHFKFDSEETSKNFLEWGHFNDDGGYELKVFLEAECRDGKIVPYDIRGGIDDEGVVLDARVRELLRITYLKPLRDAEIELANRKGSRLSQVLDSHVAFTDKQNHFLSRTIKRANKEISNFFKGETPNYLTLRDTIKEEIEDDDLKEKIDEIFEEYSQEPNNKGKELADQVNKYLKSFFGVETFSNFKISETSLKGILEKLSLHLEEVNSGLGSHNLLFIAVELLLLERQDDYTGLRLALIEEIEAHLHPQAQMRLVEYLQKECEEKKVQMILTTHSPNLASKIKLENLIICHDSHVYPMGSDYTLLEKGDYAFLERFLDITKANLFFAKGVLLVEGDAENLILPTIAKIIDCDLTQHGVSIINLRALTFKYYERIFIQKNKTSEEQMNIPVAIVTDVDTKVWEYYMDEENEANLRNKLLIAESFITKVNTQYSDKFENLIYDKNESIFNKIDDVKSYFRKFLPNEKSNLPRGFSDFIDENIESRKINETELEGVQQQTKVLKEELHTPVRNPNIKGFVNNFWTLEYELGLSCLKKLFYTAILMAKQVEYFEEAILKDCKEEANDIDSWGTPTEIAYQIYWVEMMGRGKNKLSKAIVAQFFAEILEREIKGNDTLKNELKIEIEDDDNLKYIVDAIKHATRKN